MADSKFILTADAIEVTEHQNDLPSQLQPMIEVGRERVAAGEDPDEVAQDLAEWAAALSEEDEEK